MSIEDVLGRIQQLQAMIDPQSTSAAATVAATTSTGQDFSSTLASATAGDTASTAASALPAAAAASYTASGSTALGSSVLGSSVLGGAALGGTALGSTALTGSTAGTTLATTPATTGNDIVADSIQYLGVPYKWGGTDPSTGLDCSGLVQQVYADKGIALPRTSAEQATAGTEVQGGLANAQPGDLVFFGSPVHHVGIYAGNNMMVEAPHTGTKVQVHSIDATPTHVRRIALTPTAGTAATAGTVGTTTSASSLSALAAEDPTTAMNNLGVPASLQPIFAAAAQNAGVPVSLLAAVAKVESGFNLTSVSSAGAQGLMQLMPDTAAGIGANPWDATSAVGGAAKLLRGYLDQYASVPVALAAYNAGPGAVAKYGGVPPYAETQAYVQRVGALAAAA